VRSLRCSDAAFAWTAREAARQISADYRERTSRIRWPAGSRASAGRRADRQADDEQDREQADDKDECGDVTRLRW